MADIKTNQSKVYNALKGMGFSGIGANEEEFAAKMSNPKNREKVYNALSSKGYKGIGKDFAAFDTLIYQAQQPAEKPIPVQPTAQPQATPQLKPSAGTEMGANIGAALLNKQSQPVQPAPQKQEKPAPAPQPQQKPQAPASQEGLTWQDQMAMSMNMGKAQSVAENAAKGVEALGEATKNASPFGGGNVGIGNNQNLRKGKKTFDAEKGAFVDTYLTSDGRKFNDVNQANQVQGQLDNEAANVRYNELMKSIGVDMEAEGKKDINHLLGDAYDELHKLDANIESRRKGQATTLAMGMGLAGSHGTGTREKDVDLDNLLSAKRLLERRIDALEAARDNGGFWSGTGDVLTDASSYSFGLTDLADSQAMMGISKKIDEAKANGTKPQFTDSEKALVRNYMLNQQAQSKNADNTWYEFGQSFGQTLSFMKDFALTGGGFMNIAKGGMALGAKGGAKLATKTLGDYMTKNLGTKALGKTMEYMGKGIGLAAGAEVGGLALNNTVQAASSMADVMNKQMGNLTIGKDGNLSFEGSKSLGEAVLKSQLSRGGENASELVGLAFDAVPGVLGKVIQRTKVGQFAKKIANSKYWKGYEKGMNYLGMQSLWGEGMEEEYNMARDVLIGESGWFKDPNDPSKPAFFDGEQQLKTWETVGITSMLLRVPSMIATGTQGANYYANQYNLNTSDRNMRDVFGKYGSDRERYEAVKSMIDGADNAQLAGVLNNLMNNAELSREEKEAMFMYANDLVKLRGFNIGNVVAAANGFTEPPKVSSYAVNGNSFDELDANGNVLAHHDFETEDEMRAALYEAQQNKFDADLNSDITIMKARPNYQYLELLTKYCYDNGMSFEEQEEFEATLAKPSMERTEAEQAMVEPFAKILHDTVYDNTMLHEEESAQDGVNAVESAAIDIENPNSEDIQEVTDAWLAAQQERIHLFAQNEELRQEVEQMEQQGLSHQEIISALETFRPNDVQTIINYYNQKARFEGMMNQVDNKINEEAANSRERHSFKGTMNGFADKHNVYTITDGTNEYYLVSGNITTDPTTGRITGSDSGLIIGMDLDGSFVNIGDTNGYSVMPSTQSLDQFEEQERIRLQELWTGAIDPTGTMQPQEQQTGEVGGEAGVANDTGANEPLTPESVPQNQEEVAQQPAQIPVDEKSGLKRYEQGVPVDQAIQDIQNDGFDVNEMADAYIAEAQEQIDKINAKKAKKPQDLFERKRLQDVVTYYNNIKEQWAAQNQPVVEEQPVVNPTPSQSGMTVEEKKQQRIAEAKAKYGELFDDDFTKADDVYELVSMWVGRNRNLAWDDVNGKRGLQKELGWTRRFGGDTKYIETLLAKKGEGVGVDEFAHMVWESPENAVLGEKRWTTEEIKEALLDLLKNAQSKSDVVDYALNTRIAQADAAFNDEQEALADQQEQPITEEEAPIPDGGLPFGQATDEDFTNDVNKQSNDAENNVSLQSEQGNLGSQNQEGNGVNGENATSPNDIQGVGTTTSTTGYQGGPQESVSQEQQGVSETGGNRGDTEGDRRQAVADNAERLRIILPELMDKYNSAPARVIDPYNMSKQEWYAYASECLGYFPEEDEAERFRAWVIQNVTFGALFNPATGQIDVYAQNTTPEQLENYFFHENLHAGFANVDNEAFNELTRTFWNNSTSEKSENTKQQIQKLYEDETEEVQREEYLVHLLATHMTTGNVDTLLSRLTDEQQAIVDNVLNDFGYDRQAESSARRDVEMRNTSNEAPQSENGGNQESSTTREEGSPESNFGRNEVDDYLNPRNAEEEKIISDVSKQLQQEIQAAITERDKAASELQKAQAKESERATDLFGNDNALNQPGQLFDNSDMPIDQSMEGVERRTAAERERLQQAQNKVNQLQSPEERNSRVRGALDNYRRQTSINEIEERQRREYDEYIKPLLDKSDEELQRLKAEKEESVGGDLTKLNGDKEYSGIINVITQRQIDEQVKNHKKKVNSKENLESKKQKLVERAERLEAILQDKPSDKKAQEELEGLRKRIDEIDQKLGNKIDTDNPIEAIEQAASQFKQEQEEKKAYGADNKLISQDRYEELKKRMREKLLGQANVGFDPEILQIGAEMAMFHIEAGARKFADYATRMINDLGDVVRPYLQGFYEAARRMPGMEELRKEMDSTEAVDNFDVLNYDKQVGNTVNDNKTENNEPDNSVSLQQETSEEVGRKAEDADKYRAFSQAVANDMLKAMETGEKPYKSIKDIRAKAKSLGMEVDDNGRTDILLQELVEDGLVSAARQYVNLYMVNEMLAGRRAQEIRTSRALFEDIVKLYNLQPSITQRSSNRIKMGQYSTPLPMSFIADVFAFREGMQDVLEPTAGNGMMVFAVPEFAVHANELDETRLDNLRAQKFKEVTDQDATLPFEGEPYDAIIANPPFGSAPAKDYDGKEISGLAEQITLNALSKMKDDGKAAIIIGGNMEYAPNGAIKSDKAFFTYLYDHYNVKGVIDMDGKLFSKQGTTWATRMILIDGRRSEEERAQSKVYPPVKDKAPKKATTFEELYDIAEEIRNNNNKTNGNEVLRTPTGIALPDNNDTSGNVDRSGRDGQHRQNESDGGRVESRRSSSGSQETSREKTPRNSGRRTVGVQQPGIPGLFDSEENTSESQPATGASEQGGSTSDNGQSRPADVRGNGTVTSGVGLNTPENPKETPKADIIQAKKEPVKPKAEEKRELDTEKLSYRPHNTAYSLESVAPAAMVEAMDNMLTKIEKEHGNIDEWVTKELGYDSVEEMHNALAAEQVDSVAMAIYQMQHGQGMIIGDQTGVGKGRQMAALIRWACRQGKKPVFITQKADLFSDIYRDLVDIGSGELNPFIFNSDGAMVDNNGVTVHKPLPPSAQAKVFAADKLPEGYDFAVLTYSQVNTGDAISQEEAGAAAKKNKERGAKKSKKVKEGKATPKATFLRALANDNYMFLDESHTAAGKSNTGAYFQSILKSAKGVTFASATFAKRPDTMPMYAIRTAMSKAKVKAEELIKIIENGGVTLQEIMSRALTQAGQMVRRERDMSDVVTDWKTVDDPATVKKARENYDSTIQAFNAIIDFQRNWVAPYLEALSGQLADVASSAGMRQGTEDLGIKNVPFASKTYNYTKQLMLALKVDAIVDEVVKEIRAGRHPVIALENTMGSMLDDYSPGDPLDDTTFAASLLKGLKGILRYTITDEDGKQIQQELTPKQLGPDGEAAYHEVEDIIRQSTSGIFISPLDAITEKLNQLGYKVGELTGRQQYVELDENSGEYVVRRRTDRDKKKMQREFNNGSLDVLILNKSASTGISLHASEKFSDQRQRTMIIAQPLADINDYMQMIGRIDRTGQVHRGYYINLGLPVPAEGRFLMMLSTKLKSLNANTTTSQESESNDVEAPDLLNKYGSRVIIEYLRDNPDIYVKMGEPLKKDKAKVTVSQLDDYEAQEDDARKITGYVALLPTNEQDAFYNDVVRRYNELIKYLNDTGSNDLKISVLPLRARTIEKQISSEGADPKGDNPFAGHAYVEWVDMDVLKKPMKAAEVGKVIEQLNPDVEAPKVEAKTASQERMLNDKLTPRIRQILATVEKETQAKLDKEEERYEAAKQRADEAIKEQTEKINASKRTPEQKQEAIDKYTADRRQSVEESHNNMVNKIEANRMRMERYLKMFKVGDSVLVPDDLTIDTFLGSSNGIFCGFKAKDEGVTPSTTLAVFATLDGRRKIEIKLSDWAALNRIENMTEQNWDAAHSVTLSNWDSQIPSETRKHGYIMTGNILQAFADAGEEGRVPGQLITYTDEEGNVHDGILMNQHWEPSQLKGSTVPLKSRMDEIKSLPNGDHVTSADGNVVIDRYYRIYTVTVPKSKKVGGQYYGDERLLNLIEGGNFYPYRGQLRGDVEPQNIEEVVNVLSDLGVQLKSDTQVHFDHETEMGQAQAAGRRFDEDIDNTIDVPADEYAKIAQQIATYPKKSERGHVFTDNNYYLCTDIDNKGNFRIVAALPIEGNEDLINEIRKDGRKQNFIAIPVTESTSRIISEVRSRGGRISGYDANAKRFDSGSGRNASVSVGQQANTSGNRQETGRNRNETAKESERRKSIAKHIDKLLDKLGTKSRTIVHNSLKDVPADVREHIERKHRQGKKVRGWYEDGQIHLFLPDIDSEYQAEKTIWHETVAHHGLRALIGEENLDKLLKQLWLEHRDGEMGKWVTERMQKNGWRLNEAIEEYLAREAEKNPFKEPGLWQRLRWMLAEVLHKMGFATDPTISDIQYLFWSSQNQLRENDPMGVIKQQAFLFDLERQAANTPYINMYAARPEDIENPDAEDAYPDETRYSEETDEETIERLEKEPKVKAYRAMQLIDGKLYPPMAAKQNGKLVNPIELGKWEKADEHPEMADENGKFKLDKGNGKSLKAAYNPYIHTSTTMLNDQFSEAQTRPNLVVVEVEVPESELTSGYKAEKAKDSVGKLEWKAGVIQGQLSGTREVILSRWDKPIRIVPTKEVAQHIADMIKGKVDVMPSNVVTPQQREALEKLGVKFVETDNRGFLKGGEHNGSSYTAIYGKKAKSHRFDEDEESPLEYSAKKVYDDRLNRIETVFTEAYQDAMVSLKTAQNAIAGDKEIPDSQNAYMAENLMHGKNKNEQDTFNRMFRDPLIRTINKIMNLTGMNWGDVDRYVYTKSGLERNREFFVRDWLEAQRNRTIHRYEDLDPEAQDIYDSMAATIEDMFEDGDITEDEKNQKLKQALQKAHQRFIDEVETDYQLLKTERYQDLQIGMITFPDYLEDIDRFIRSSLDSSYKPEEHDYSGLRAMFGDEEGEYDEAEIIEELMNAEDMIESDNVDTLWEQINAATKYGLERYREAGMRSDEQIDRVEQMFHWYVPMRGFKEDTGEDMYQYFTGKEKSKNYIGGLLKHAKGRGSEANFPISTIFAMSYKAISDCNQNLVNQKLYRLCQANPNDLVILSDSWARLNETTGEWEEVAPEIPEDADEEEVRQITLDWEDEMRQLALEHKAKKIKGREHFDYKPMDKKKQSEHIIDVRINGQPRKMIVTGNPRMAQALNGQLRFEHGKNVFSKWNSAIKNFMASVFTSYSPTFAMRNMFRDWTHFRTMLGVREGHGYASAANKYYRQSLFKMVGLFKKYRDGTLDDRKQMERDFKDFMDEGGITGFVFMQKLDDIQKQMEKIYKDQKAGKTIRLNNNLWESILGAVEALNEGIENNARFATYRASRHYAGRTKARSAYDAKEITVNFNRKGAGGKTAGFKSRDGVLPKKAIEDAAKAFGITSQILGEGRIFFNATVQAIATTFKNFQNPDGSLNKKYIAKWAAKYALPPFMFGLALPMINKALAAALGGDDGDDDPYANLAEWTRRKNLCFYIGNGNFITIPIGQELAAFLALGDMLAGATYAPDLKPVDKNFGDEFIGVMNTFSPVDIDTKLTKGGLTEDPIDETIGRTFSVLAPLVAVQQNLGWTGRPIYREDVYPNDKYSPEYQMVYSGTNPVLVGASKLANELSGGDDVTRGGIQVNPAIVQYLWEQYTGGPGKVFSNTISIGKDAKDILTGSDNDFNIRKVEGLKAFVQQGDDRTAYYRTQAKYRKYKADADELSFRVSGYEKAAAEDPAALLKLEEIVKGEDFVRMQIIKEAEKTLSQINKAANKAEGKERKELRQIYNQSVKEVVDLLDSVGKE